jgi:hypothetical protein
MDDEYKDEPIQLVYINDNGDFEITVEGINFLPSLKHKKVIKV